MVAGALVALMLGLFAISYFVDQVIVGVVLNVLVIGMTSFMFSQVLAPNAAALNSPAALPRGADPGAGRHPADRADLLPADRRSSTCSTSPSRVVTLALYRTRWGLRVRAVGEHPKAADTVGIKVNRTRYRTILLAGAIAGMGGAFYTLVSVPQFNREMTGGAGYIALAAVIFGKWDPIRATLAALLFGFASNLQGVLSVIGSPVPEPVHADAALRRHHLRRGRPGRPVAAPGGGRSSLPKGASRRLSASRAASGRLGEHARAPMPVARSSTRRLPWCRSYVGPPGVRVPSRAIAPGTRSRYQPKSSPPRLCGGRTRGRARPSTPLDRAGRGPRWTSRSLTTGGTPRW